MRSGVAFLSILALSVASLTTAQSTAQPAPSERKVTLRVAPDYPDLARAMHLRGVVKVEAMVRPNGSVRATRILGGNPVLVDAAANAVAKWKFEPAATETTEVVQLTFVPR